MRTLVFVLASFCLVHLTVTKDQESVAYYRTAENTEIKLVREPTSYNAVTTDNPARDLRRGGGGFRGGSRGFRSRSSFRGRYGGYGYGGYGGGMFIMGGPYYAYGMNSYGFYYGGTSRVCDAKDKACIKAAKDKRTTSWIVGVCITVVCIVLCIVLCCCIGRGSREDGSSFSASWSESSDGVRH
jgi:hypothetical protein